MSIADARRKPSPRPNSLLIRLLLLTAAGAVLAQSVAASAVPRWRAAATAYQRAQRLQAALGRSSNPAFASYLRVIREYQLVYRSDPEYREAPAALAAAAQTYAQAGRAFANDRYYSKSIDAYRFLIAQYPNTRLAERALFTIAEIYQRDIENPEAARAIYREYLKRYPRSARAADAGLAIARINDELSRWNSSQSPDEAQPFTAGSEPHTHSLAQVESIRHWLAPDYTRVVIQTGQEVKFNTARLENPPRLIFDLDNTHLGPDLARKTFLVQHGYLRRIRVAQFKPKVTRVVLDVPHIEEYTVFSLQHPFRLVIDVRGDTPEQAELQKRVSTAARDLSPGIAAERAPHQAEPGTLTRRVTTAARSSQASFDGPGAGVSDVADSPVTGDESVALPGSNDAELAGGAPTLTRALGLKIRRIVIDPGHGGHDTGTIGPAGIEEKNVVLDVALRLRRLVLRRLGCQVVMTRSTDKFIPLEERTAIANQDGADLFVSIHANASHDPSARGIETYYLNFTSDPEALAVAARENATSEQSVFQLQSLVRKIALSEKIGESRDFAKVVDHQLMVHLDEDGDRQPDRGIKKAPFVVLIGANMPSILVEISFLSNPHDARLLHSPRFRQRIAQALYDGIASYAETLGTIRVAQRAPLSLQRNTPSF